MGAKAATNAAPASTVLLATVVCATAVVKDTEDCLVMPLAVAVCDHTLARFTELLAILVATQPSSVDAPRPSK